MANLATVLKDEIRRLARKETKTLTETMRRQSAQHRRDIADLKRQVASLERKVALLEKNAWKRPPSGSGEGDASASSIRFSAKGLASHREKLGLAAHEYALLLGVSPQTLYNWEQERSRPRASQLGKLASIRGMRKKEALARLEQLA